LISTWIVSGSRVDCFCAWLFWYLCSPAMGSIHVPLNPVYRWTWSHFLERKLWLDMVVADMICLILVTRSCMGSFVAPLYQIESPGEYSCPAG
jgi:hypothetical protein